MLKTGILIFTGSLGIGLISLGWHKDHKNLKEALSYQSESLNAQNSCIVSVCKAMSDSDKIDYNLKKLYSFPPPWNKIESNPIYQNGSYKLKEKAISTWLNQQFKSYNYACSDLKSDSEKGRELLRDGISQAKSMLEYDASLEQKNDKLQKDLVDINLQNKEYIRQIEVHKVIESGLRSIAELDGKSLQESANNFKKLNSQINDLLVNSPKIIYPINFNNEPLNTSHWHDISIITPNGTVNGTITDY